MDNFRFTRSSIWRPTGLKISADNGILLVEDINPEKVIRNRVTRWELFRIGFWLLRKSLTA